MSIMDLVNEKEQADKASIALPPTHPPINVPIYHYERRTDNFQAGGVYRNFNGSDYLILERYKDNNYLVKNISSGMHIVASGLHQYMRHPEDDPDQKQYGIEWDSGRYLSSREADIDRDYLREQYGEYVPPDLGYKSIIFSPRGGESTMVR